MFFWCHRLDQNTNEKIWQISALESKIWWNQQDKGTFLQYYNLHIIYGLFNVSYDLTTFQILGQKFAKFFVGILVQTITPKGHFEINWPIASHYLIQMSPLAFLLLLRNGGKTFMKSSWDMFVCFLDTFIEEWVSIPI